MEKLKISPFNININLVPCPTILVIGKRFAGKSTLSSNLAYICNCRSWAAWCGTKDTQDYWSKHFGSSATVRGVGEKDIKSLHRIIKKQDIRIRNRKLKGLNIDRNDCIGLIFDDVTSSRKFCNNQCLTDLFSNGRHYRFVIIICCQYLKQLPPSVRTNTDYIFILHNSKRTCKIIHDEFIEYPDDFHVFMEIIRIVTSKKNSHGNLMYNALVYSNITSTTELSEIFSVYTSDKDPNEIKLGHPLWRQYCKHHYIDIEKREAFESLKKERLLTNTHNGVQTVNGLTHYRIEPKRKTQITIVLDSEYGDDIETDIQSNVYT